MQTSSGVKAYRRLATTVSQPRVVLMSLLLGGLIMAPAQAVHAEEIPFFVTNDAGSPQRLNCAGPWGRRAAFCWVNVPAGAQHEHFYSAEVSIFSPFGEWRCSAETERRPDPGGCGIFPAPIPRTNEVTFCLDAPPDRIVPVELVIQNNGRLGVNFSPPPCSSMAAIAFLGDTSLPGRLDHDVFRFDGESGETITVTLERDGASGSAGEIAELILREERGPALDTRTGALPLELTVALPAAGGYAIEAREARASKAGAGGAFRGNYRLRVESDAGENRGESLLLEPTGRTEP